MNFKTVMKALGIAFAASLFSEGAAQYFGLGAISPLGRMILVILIAIIVLKI